MREEYMYLGTLSIHCNLTKTYGNIIIKYNIYYFLNTYTCTVHIANGDVVMYMYLCTIMYVMS